MRSGGEHGRTQATATSITDPNAHTENARALAAFIGAYRHVLVLTGAGVSTPSGIPDYRDFEGRWKRGQPIQHARFMNDPVARQRYWARSFSGWPAFAAARPNAAHRALASLEAAGHVHHLVTQNVDGLHQRAGSRRVLDLHGRLDLVDCQVCAARLSRHVFQDRLTEANPVFAAGVGTTAPDGDALIDENTVHEFNVPCCDRCGGILKPNVVFFGGTIPPARQRRVLDKLETADALLVVGSSLTVFSGYRIVREARARGMPVTVINKGRTRADAEITLKVSGDCATLLPRLISDLPC